MERKIFRKMFVKREKRGERWKRIRRDFDLWRRIVLIKLKKKPQSV